MNRIITHAKDGERVLCLALNAEMSIYMQLEVVHALESDDCVERVTFAADRQQVTFKTGGMIRFATQRQIARLRGCSFDQAFVHESLLDSVNAEMLRCELALLTHTSGSPILTLTA